MDMDPRGGWGFTPPRRHLEPHLEGGGVGGLKGLKPPSPSPAVWGLTPWLSDGCSTEPFCHSTYTKCSSCST